MEVVADSPAEQAGLQVGDRITAVDDQTIDADHALADVIAGYTPGQQVTLTVVRDSETLTVKLTLGENPDQAGQPWVGISYRMMPAIETSPNGSGG
jgi:S1-C subfamily serine protease